jgi:hypothetical protein
VDEGENSQPSEQDTHSHLSGKAARWLWAFAQVAHVVTATVQVIILVSVLHVPLPW